MVMYYREGFIGDLEIMEQKRLSEVSFFIIHYSLVTNK